MDINLINNKLVMRKRGKISTTVFSVLASEVNQYEVVSIS